MICCMRSTRHLAILLLVSACTPTQSGGAPASGAAGDPALDPTRCGKVGIGGKDGKDGNEGNEGEWAG
jgi:hypothetical protein